MNKDKLCQMMLGQLYNHVKEINAGFISHALKKLKRIRKLEITLESIKYFEKNIGRTFQDLDLKAFFKDKMSMQRYRIKTKQI